MGEGGGGVGLADMFIRNTLTMALRADNGRECYYELCPHCWNQF